MVADRGPATAAVTILFVVLATVFVAARFFTRAYLVRSIKQDDWWILAAWLVAVSFSVAICVGVHFGLGKHGIDIPDGYMPALRKSEYAFSVLYNPSLMLTKTSIIVFYLSVMSRDVDAVFKWLNWLTLAVVNVAGFALTLLNIFQCRPVSAGYRYPRPEDARCTDIIALYQSSAPVNIITDIAILILPMPILTRMRLPKKQKIILIFTFGFGIFVTVVDVIRIAYLQDAALDKLRAASGVEPSGSHPVESNDFPWYASLSFMWSAVEVNIGIVCACVPCLKPLFARFLPSFIKDASDGSTHNDSFDGPENPEKWSCPTSPIDANPLNNPAAFRQASTAEYLGDDDGDQMGFLNFLSGPPSDESLQRRPSRAGTFMSTITRVGTSKSTVSDFGFVKMDHQRNMLKLNNRQSVWPVAVVTVIFFLWGFAYGLLDTLNARFQTVDHLVKNEVFGLRGAYWGGYFLGPITIGRFILSRYGFKATMIAGLCIYGCGTLVFWPSAVLLSYSAFIVSNFIVGLGLSCLEVAANPYTALCGPLEYAEVRLNLSQAFQAVGTVFSPLLAQKVLFKNVNDATSLVNVQWAYLGIALFVFLLAIVFFYIPLPEASDEQLEELAERRSAVYRRRVGPFQVIWVTLALGIFAQFCYVGAQEGVGTTAADLMDLYMPNSRLTSFDFVTLGHTCFAVGRFLQAFLNYVLKPRWILLILFIGCTIFSGVLTTVTGNSAAGILMLNYFFEAGIFAIVFAISMRGMGAHTKLAAAMMTSAISGGAVPPAIAWAVSKSKGLPYSYSVVCGVFAIGTVFPLYLNFIPAARAQVDPIHDRGRRPRMRGKRTQSFMSDPDSSTRQFGLIGILARNKKKHRVEQAMAQHIENTSDDGAMKITQGFDEKGILEVPSPVHDVSPKGFVGSLAPWRGKSSAGSSSSGSSGGDGGIPSNRSRASTRDMDIVRSDGSVAGPAPQPNVPRAWTERDDVIDDYHNALKGMGTG